MEFLKVVKRRSFLSEVVYVLLNIGMAILLMALIRITGLLWPSFLLVLLSKWRVLAVRPRFWFANVQADLVSFIVSIGYIILLYNSNPSVIGDIQSTIAHAILVILYITWLLIIRPKSKRIYIVAQAGTALFVGITTIFSATFGWPSSAVVLLSWLVGYATARHVLNSYDNENHILLLSIAWGLIIAEISWLAYHWTIAYRLPIINNLLLPQASLIVACFAFIVYKSYDSFYHNQKIRINDILMPLLFSIGIILVLVLAFNDWRN
ncbi:MAG TPA: hypothetical protein PLO25_03300 [Candidatus Saccharibacteria bacterium]|nr:hypothetical protein [Candidatus Saccharibacteria bacterium]